MTTLVNTFEGGTSGTSLTAGNSGGVSGNVFDSVAIGSGGTLQFSNAQAAHGGLSCLCQTTTANGTDAAWSTSMGTLGQVWFRAYLFFTANPTAQTRFFTASGGGPGLGRFNVTPTGKVLVSDANGAAITTSATSITLNQWVRVEGFVIGSATVGQTEMKLFNVMDSFIPTETNTSAATQNTGGSLNFYAFGPNAGVASQGPYYMDDLGLSSTGYLGPSLIPGMVAIPAWPGQAWLRRYHHRQNLGPPSQCFASVLPATATAAGSQSAQTGKGLTGTATAAGALSNQVSRLLATTVTAAGALSNRAGKLLTGTATAAGTVTRQAGKAISGTATATGTLARQVGKLVTGTATAAGSQKAQVGKQLPAGATASGTLARAAAKTLASTATASGSVTRAIGRILTTTATASGTILRGIGRILKATVSAVGTLIIPPLPPHVFQAQVTITPAGPLAAQVAITILVPTANAAITPAGAGVATVAVAPTVEGEVTITPAGAGAATVTIAEPRS